MVHKVDDYFDPKLREKKKKKSRSEKEREELPEPGQMRFRGMQRGGGRRAGKKNG